MSGSRVSIIIPSYNYGRYLARCVDAVLAQTLPPAEIIVVDDGSSDDTRDVMRPYAGRVRYVPQEHQGLTAARNTGARISSGDCLLFCDADDFLAPHALEWLVALRARTRGEIAYGKCRQYFEDGREGREIGDASADGAPPVPARANFWKSRISTPGAALVSREIFDRVGGFVAPCMEDREFWIRAGMIGSFASCDRVVLHKSTRSDSLLAHRGLRLYWSARIQLDFLSWCEQRGFRSSDLDVTPDQVVQNAIKYLIRGGHVRYLWLGLAEFRRRGLNRPSVLRALWREGVPALMHQASLALHRVRSGAPADTPSVQL